MITVRRAVGDVLAIPLEPRLRGDVLWSDLVMGYTVETSTCAQDAIVRRGTHASRIRDADGRHTERTQSDHEQYGRDRLQLARRHARTATSTSNAAMRSHSLANDHRLIP